MSVDRVRNIVLHDYGRDASKTAILDIVQQSVSLYSLPDYSKHCCLSDSNFLVNYLPRYK